MGTRSTAALNPTLTNYAQGLAQDTASAIADFLAPVVVVPAGLGQYKAYNQKNAFQIYNTRRGIGGPATRIKFEADDPTFNCQPNALEIPIDDAERDAAGDTGAQRLEEAKTSTLVSDAVISHENEVVTAVKAGVSAVGGVGVWSNADNDPVAEIDAQIEAIATKLGMMPNRIVFGLGAWRVARNHAKVIARQPGAALVGTSTSQFASMLLNPAVEIKVGTLSKDTTKFGKAENKVNIVGGEVFIFYASANPTQYDPSFAKTFRVQRGGVDAVRMYRDEQNRSDILAVDWSDDIKVASTSAVKRITLS